MRKTFDAIGSIFLQAIFSQVNLFTFRRVLEVISVFATRTGCFRWINLTSRNWLYFLARLNLSKKKRILITTYALVRSSLVVFATKLKLVLRFALVVYKIVFLSAHSTLISVRFISHTVGHWSLDTNSIKIVIVEQIITKWAS